MRIDEIAFQGYKAFAGQETPRLTPPEGTEQHLSIRPLTLVFGKNNSGKSTVVRLPRLLLGSMACNDPDIVLPVEVGQLRYGSGFFDLLPNRAFFGRPRFTVRAAHEEQSLELTAMLHAPDAFSGDEPPRMWSYEMRAPEQIQLGEAQAPMDSGPRFGGLLPPDTQWDGWRRAAALLLDNMTHLGPARAAVRDNYVNAQPSRLGLDGVAAPQWLRALPALADAVGEWYQTHMDGWRLSLLRQTDSFALMVRKNDQLSANLAQSGEGLQQVLPVVVQQFLRQQTPSPWFLDVVEQPEIHLHASAQAPLADLFIDTALQGRGALLVESHSLGILLRVQRRIAEGRITPNQVAIYFVAMTDQGSHLKRVQVDEQGELDWWPSGVFEEDFREVAAIRRAQRGRATDHEGPA